MNDWQAIHILPVGIVLLVFHIFTLGHKIYNYWLSVALLGVSIVLLHYLPQQHPGPGVVFCARHQREGLGLFIIKRSNLLNSQVIGPHTRWLHQTADILREVFMCVCVNARMHKQTKKELRVISLFWRPGETTLVNNSAWLDESELHRSSTLKTSMLLNKLCCVCFFFSHLGYQDRLCDWSKNSLEPRLQVLHINSFVH